MDRNNHFSLHGIGVLSIFYLGCFISRVAGMRGLSNFCETRIGRSTTRKAGIYLQTCCRTKSTQPRLVVSHPEADIPSTNSLCRQQQDSIEVMAIRSQISHTNGQALPLPPQVVGISALQQKAAHACHNQNHPVYLDRHPPPHKHD